MLNLEMIYGIMAAVVLLFVISTAYILELKQNARELRGRISSLKESLIISRNKEDIALHELTKTGRELKQTKELLAKAERAAIMPDAPEPVGLIRSELEPVEVKAKAIHYAEEDNKEPERFIKGLLLRELDPYISIDRRMSEIEAKITILKEK